MTSPDPLAPLAATLRDGRRPPTSYLDDLRGRFADLEPDVRAFVDAPEWDRLHEEAEALAADHAETAAPPPLFGVPVGVKDIFHADGLPTRAGSELPPEALAGPEAAAVSALRAAGALVLGKTHTTEFACFEPAPTRNPHDLDHTPGGSSSGSAAAVAAGLCPLALGSQTVGSVVRPAAFCGVVGFKPSYGRIPMDGVIPVAESLDHVGFFTADVEGAALAAAVLCDEWAVLPDDDERPVLGVPDGPYLEQASSEGLDAFEASVDALADAGYEVRRVDALSDIEAINERHDDLMVGEMAIAHHAWFEAYGERYREGTADLVREGRGVTAETIARGRAGRTDLRERLADRADEAGIDVWISPSAPGPAPASLDTTGDPTMNLPWTHAGLPTMNLPAGRVDGLPVGVQCAAAFGADERLVSWADGLADALSGAVDAHRES